MYVVPDRESLNFVDGRAVCRLEGQLQHRRFSCGRCDDFLAALHIDKVDVGQEVLLRALIRVFVIEARLHAWFAGSHTAYTCPVDGGFWRPAHESAGSAIGVPVLDVGVRYEHDARAVRSRFA